MNYVDLVKYVNELGNMCVRAHIKCPIRRHESFLSC